MPDPSPQYPFTFRKRITIQRFPELANLPPGHYAEIVVTFNGTEQQALNAARQLCGHQAAAHAVRMALDYQGLHPSILEDEGLSMLAQLHSEQTGQSFLPLPAADVPVSVFAALLKTADHYWEHAEQHCRITPADASRHGIPFQQALTPTPDKKERNQT